jgi:non-specific serine/threonine protein kinase
MEAETDPFTSTVRDTSPDEETSAEALHRQIRDALERLDDLAFLETLPLSRQLGSEARGQLAHRGLALRQALLNTIQILGDPRRNARFAQSLGYRILSSRYVEGMVVSAIAQQLGLSRSAYYREEKRAIEAVTSLLATNLERDRAGDRTSPAAVGTPRVQAKLGNLPLPLSSFVGREREIDDLVRRFSDPYGPRLVTLTGAGGSGKSRLAIEVTWRLAADFPDGVFLVELGMLDDPALLAATLATPFGVRGASEQLIAEALVRHLASQRLLLVVDNCEHVIGPAAQLVETLVRGCPRLRVIATSRESLRILGEVTYHVPPLSMPPPGDAPPDEPLASYETLRLFADRARAVDDRFQLSATNSPLILEICRRLDGLPLAIELAAARLDTLTLEQLDAGLGSRFELLTNGARTSQPHHRSLLALVRWSYELLPLSERALLRAVSVFPGTFDLEGATEVAQGLAGPTRASTPVRADLLGLSVGNGAPPGQGELPGRSFGLVDLLGNLVAKSLVRVDRRGASVRFRLLETIREFGRRELELSDELELTERRLANWAMALSVRAEAARRGPGRAEWAQRLELEDDTLQVVIAWSIKRDLPRALALLTTLNDYWAMVGRVQQGRTWSSRALAAASDARVENAQLAEILLQDGFWEAGTNLSRAAGYFDRARLIFSRVGNPVGEVRAIALAARSESQLGRRENLTGYAERTARLLELITQSGNRQHEASGCLANGYVLVARGDRDQALGSFQLAAELAASAQDQHLAALALSALADGYLDELNFDRARSAAKRAIELLRPLRDEENVGWNLLVLGNVARLEGDLATARASLEEALGIIRRLDFPPAVARTFAYLASVEYRERHDDGAATLLREALGIVRPLQRPLAMWTVVLMSALVEARQGQLEAAVAHLSAVVAHREENSILLVATDASDCECALAEARHLMGDEPYREAVERGQSMTLDAILADLG